MSNIHKFKVEPIEGHRTCAKVIVDGEQCICSSYKIEHYAGSLPMVNINLVADVQYEQDAEINIVNLREIASLIDKKTFKKFCRVWKEIHDEA
jgi:DNA-directed RNA polymerase subunit L